MKRKTNLIVAIDVDSFTKAKYLVRKLYPSVKIFKVGSHLFTNCGPKIINYINSLGAKVFLDLKYYDIPSVVASAVKEAAKLKVFMVDVHASGGSSMIKEVLKATKGIKNRPIILGVTVLTSFNQKELNELGISRSLNNQVLTLAKNALKLGIDGIVCSPHEISLLRKKLGRKFIIVSPGIRPCSMGDDQKRFMSPQEAAVLGADYIVVGRPIIKAIDPQEEAKIIIRSIKNK